MQVRAFEKYIPLTLLYRHNFKVHQTAVDNFGRNSSIKKWMASHGVEL